MACHVAHQIGLLRAQAVALVTKHVEAVHPGSHALLNCGPVRVISPIAVAVDVSGLLVADTALEPPRPSIPGCFISGAGGIRGGDDSVHARAAPGVRCTYAPLAAAHTLGEMEHVLQEINPANGNSPGKRACDVLQPADKRLRVNMQRRQGRWYIGESTLPCATYVFVMCLCDSQVDDVLAGRCRAFERDLASRPDDELTFCDKDSYVVCAVSATGIGKTTRPSGPLHMRI